jgi:hypothetical protein
MVIGAKHSTAERINMTKIFRNDQKISLMKVNSDAQKQPLQARLTC